MQPTNAVPDRPFTAVEARTMGLSPDQLRGKSFVHVSQGLYRRADWDFDLDAAARALCVCTPGAWISHGTAARLHGLFLPPWLSDSTTLHLSKPRKLPEVRRKGICGHTALTFPDEVDTAGELRLTSRARTWLDLARTLPLRDVVCMGDQLIRVPRPALEGRSVPYATRESLRAMVSRHPNLQGVVRAREALTLMRVGADSAPETLLRLAMVDGGLPEPELQLTLWGGPNAPSADAGYGSKRIALQFDGAHHLDELQKISDRRREKAFEAAGWTVLIFTQKDYAEGFDTAVHRIKDALGHAWTDPTVASGFANPCFNVPQQLDKTRRSPTR